MEYLLEVQHLNKNLNTFALHDISFTLKTWIYHRSDRTKWLAERPL